MNRWSSRRRRRVQRTRGQPPNTSSAPGTPLGRHRVQGTCVYVYIYICIYIYIYYTFIYIYIYTHLHTHTHTHEVYDCPRARSKIDLALTVVYVPYSLDNGSVNQKALKRGETQLAFMRGEQVMEGQASTRLAALAKGLFEVRSFYWCNL